MLAKNVLEGNTKGYKNHPQLFRFKNYENPIKAINYYLYEVFKEACSRGYNFDKTKIKAIQIKKRIPINSEQIKFEFKHLLKKLKSRDKERYRKIVPTKKIELHPLFFTKKGKIESWEKVKG